MAKRVARRTSSGRDGDVLLNLIAHFVDTLCFVGGLPRSIIHTVHNVKGVYLWVLWCGVWMGKPATMIHVESACSCGFRGFVGIVDYGLFSLGLKK